MSLIIYIYISISPPLKLILVVYIQRVLMYQPNTHSSHTMAGKGASGFTRKQKSKKSKVEKKRLLNKQNQRCPGCLNKSCPKKFNKDEDKCGES